MKIDPGAAVTANYKITVTSAPAGTDTFVSPLKQAKLEVDGITAKYGVSLLDWKVQPNVLETTPPQSLVEMKLGGTLGSVAQAISAISDLDREI